MIRLSREIRFALVSPEQVPTGRPTNSWSGWPSSHLLVPHLKLLAEISGKPNSETGYLCDIKIIDEILRSIVLESMIPRVANILSAEECLRIVVREFLNRWDHPAKLVGVTLEITPCLKYALKSSEMNTAMKQSDAKVRMTQQFEFSAAHRLHCDSLSETENENLFGKCNNPNGHGHNYVFEVTVAKDVLEDPGQVVPLGEFESIVKRLVVDRLDHKHLNHDVDYFAQINPTVENIAKAIFGWLNGETGDAELVKIRVYETPKTWAEYVG